MDLKKLKQFLLSSNEASYAGGKSKKWIKEKDGSTTIPFEKGPWKSHDNFFGGEPYGGRTIVFYKKQPIWIMIYYGWVKEGVNADLIYEVLRNALRQMPPNHPFRGPKEYKENKYIYTNKWQGSVDSFSGQETIKQGNKILYKANYMGGLVDQRKEP